MPPAAINVDHFSEGIEEPPGVINNGTTINGTLIFENNKYDLVLLNIKIRTYFLMAERIYDIPEELIYIRDNFITLFPI